MKMLFSKRIEKIEKYINPPSVTEDNIVLGYMLRKVLKIFFIWSDGEKNAWFYIKLGVFYSYVTASVFGILGALYHSKTTSGLNLEKFCEAASGFLMYVWAMASMTFFSRKQGIYENMLDDLADFSTYEKPDRIERLNKKMNIFLAGIVLFMWTLLISSTVFNWMIYCEDYVEDICGMITIYWLPIENYYTRWNRRWSLLLQIFSVFLAAEPSFFGPLCLVVVSELMVNRIDHLIKMIEQIPTLESRKKRHAQVAKCVIYHQKILELADEFQEHSYYYLLCHVPYTTFMVTLISIQLMIQIKFLDIANLFFWLFYISLLCISGERLLTKSVAIGNACYLNIPFGEDTITQKDLLFMIATNREFSISAGMNEKCNHEKFVEVLKTSYSFITLLSSLKN